MERIVAILGLLLCGISAQAQTLAGTMGAIGVASALQGIGSNAAAIGLSVAQNAVNNLNGQTTGAAATANATPRPAAPAAPAPAPARPTPAAPAPAAPAAPGGGAGAGATTGGTGGGPAAAPTGGGGYGGRYMNNGYGRGMRGSANNSQGMVGRASTPRRPVVVLSGSLRTARLNLRLGFNSYAQPSAGGATTP